MVREEIKRPYSSWWIVAGVAIVYLVCKVVNTKLENSVSGGKGLPLFLNGGDWEESREVIYYPDGTKFSKTGKPRFSVDTSDDDQMLSHILAAIYNGVVLIVRTCVACIVVITATICFKLYRTM